MIPGIKKVPGGITAEWLVSRMSDAGHRMTVPRQMVLREIAAYESSFTAGALLDDLSRVAPEVGRATVFRTLELLVELGLLQRVHTEAGGTWGHSYILCNLAGTHHHHLVCTNCGQIADFAGCSLDTLLNELLAHTSFKVEGHHLELYGRCERCHKGAQE